MQVHPSQISPGESFDIFYFIRNHTDATTYYIRAKVYDVRTGELLATHTLTQSSANTRLWIKTIDAPPDPVGYGRNIVAIATVYTDSGYTTKSENYEEQEQYYLIKAAPLQLGGGGVDYRALREMMEEVVAKKLEALPKPSEFPAMPFDAIVGKLGAIQREINRIPKALFDGSSLSKDVAELRTALEGRPQFEKTDLAPLLTQTARLSAVLSEMRAENKKASSAVLDGQQSELRKMAATIFANVEQELKTLMSKQELTIPLTALMREKPRDAEPFDMSHLYAQ